MRVPIYGVLLMICVLVMRESVCLDMVWVGGGSYGTLTGNWITPTGWLSPHINITEQIMGGFPGRPPNRGDDVFINVADMYSYYVSSDRVAGNLCRHLLVGDQLNITLQNVTDRPNNSMRALKVAGGSFIVGLKSGVRQCSTSYGFGSGTSVGSNKRPNYFYLVANDQRINSVGKGGDTWIIQMETGGSVITDPLLFNYTIQDFGDGLYQVVYYANLVGTNYLYVYCSDLGDPLPGTPWPVNFYDVAPPLAISAEFCQKGVCIVITFDLNTDRAGLGGHWDCRIMFNETIYGPTYRFAADPSDNYCYWRNLSKLVIVLAHGATILPGDNVTIIGGIRAAPPFITDPSPPQSIRVTTPLPPHQPFPPFLEIDGPNILSSCANKLYLTVISTHGTGGRPFASGIHWSIPGNLPNSAQIQAILSSSQWDVFIPSNLLATGVTYTFTAIAQNYFGVFGSASHWVTKTDTNITVNIEGGSTMELRRSQDITLTVAVSVDCPMDDDNLIYKWEDTASTGILNGLETEFDILVIPAKTFLANKTYVLRATVYVNGTRTFAYDTVTLEVVFAPIQAYILSHNRAVYRGVDIVIDASVTVDPDDLLDTYSIGMNYTWACVQNSNPRIGEPCWSQPSTYLDQPENWKISMIANVLQPGQYIFSVVVNQGTNPNGTPMKKSKVVSVYNIQANAVPTVQVEALKTTAAAVGILPSNEDPILKLTCSVTAEQNDPPYNLYWDVSPSDFDITQSYTNATLYGLVGSTTNSLLLKPGVLLAGIEFVIRCRAENQYGNGSASVLVLADEPPWGGYCFASPVATADQMFNYYIACPQWEVNVEIGELLYFFTFVDPISGIPIPLSMAPLKRSGGLFLVPPGVTTIVATIMNGLQSSTTYTLSITPIAFNPAVTDEDLNSLVNVELATIGIQGESNPFLQLTLYIMAYLNEEDRQNVLAQEQSLNMTGRSGTLRWLGIDRDAKAPQSRTQSQEVFTTDVNFTAAQKELKSAIRNDCASLFDQYFVWPYNTYSIWALSAMTAWITSPNSETTTDVQLTILTFFFDYGVKGWLDLNLINVATASLFSETMSNILEAMPYTNYKYGNDELVSVNVVAFIESVGQSFSLGDWVGRDPILYGYGSVFSVVTSDYLDLEMRNIFQLNDTTVTLPVNDLFGQLNLLGVTRVDTILTILKRNPYYWKTSSRGVNAPVVKIDLVLNSGLVTTTIRNTAGRVLIEMPRNNRPQAADPTLPVTLWSKNNMTCDWWSSSDATWGNSFTSQPSQFCHLVTTKYTVLDDNNLLGVTVCSCNHLTEFTTIQSLYVPSGTFKFITMDIWWFVALALGVLTFILVGFWMFTVVHRWQQMKKEEERYFPTPPAKEMETYGEQEVYDDQGQGGGEGEGEEWDEGEYFEE